MSESSIVTFNPDTDLILKRVVDIPPKLMWKAWTEPHHLKQWFAPKPLIVVDARVDLRPGGVFRTVMRDPAGTEYGGDGCYLEIVEFERIVFTDALGPGFRPSEEAFFTAAITFESRGSGTKYAAHAMHMDPQTKRKHEEMGFHSGWGTCLDQLVAHMKQNPM